MAKSVAVISCRHEDRRYAIAATAVSELSMAPPSMLIAINRETSIFAPLSAGASFCINLLSSGQEEISRACGGGLRGEARFEGGAWTDLFDGAPGLREAQANIVCRNVKSVVHGSHGVFFGEAVQVLVSGEIDPLLYVDGGYAALARRGPDRA